MAKSSSVSMKLLIDTQTKRVLFAEAGKDCVDFLFHILSLPVATLITLLRKHDMVGSLANLYESLENLDDSYIQANQRKDIVLRPIPQGYGSSNPLLLLNDAPTEKKLYRCFAPCALTVSDDPRSVCPKCSRKMTCSMSYVSPITGLILEQHSDDDQGGFVKGLVMYMVTDDLVVKPMSTISSITMLNQFDVKEVGKLEEKVVSLGMQEAVNLLKASLQSEKVLTDVFLKGKAFVAAPTN